MRSSWPPSPNAFAGNSSRTPTPAGPRCAAPTWSRTRPDRSRIHSTTSRTSNTKPFPRCPRFPRTCCSRAGTNYPDDVRALYLQLPQLDPRIPALARQIVGRATISVRSGARRRELPAQPLRLHAGSFRHTARRSAGLFPVPAARRPLRIFRHGHDRDAAHAWAFPRATSMASCPANTTASAATTSSAPATPIAGWRSSFPGTAG